MNAKQHWRVQIQFISAENLVDEQRFDRLTTITFPFLNFQFPEFFLKKTCERNANAGGCDEERKENNWIIQIRYR